MLFTCPQGCQEEIGMVRAKEGLHRCDKHGEVLVYGKALGRSVGSGTGRTVERKPLKRGKGFAASKAQQEKVVGLPCVGCGREAGALLVIDAAHLTHRGVGGCQDDPLCVVPLCRDPLTNKGCHPDFDAGRLDLLSKLIDNGYFPELAHAIEVHELSPLTLLERTTGQEWNAVPTPTKVATAAGMEGRA